MKTDIFTQGSKATVHQSKCVVNGRSQTNTFNFSYKEDVKQDSLGTQLETINIGYIRKIYSAPKRYKHQKDS